MENMYNSTALPDVKAQQGVNLHQITLWMQVPIGSAIVVGNIMTLAILTKAKQIQMSLRVLMANMAIADTLVGVVFIFNCIIFYQQHLLTPAVCAIRYGIIYTSIFVSTTNVSVMSLDRCLTIKFPYRYPVWIYGQKVLLASILSWLLNIFMSVASLYRSFADFRVCIFLDLAKMETLVIPGVLINTYMLVVIVAYFFIVQEVRRHVNQIGVVNRPPPPTISVIENGKNKEAGVSGQNRNVAGLDDTRKITPTNRQEAAPGETSRTPPTSMKKYIAATKTVTIIIGAYVCFNTPVLAILLHIAVNIDLMTDPRYIVMINSAFFFMVLNSLANPIIYQMRMKAMRLSCLRIFCSNRCNRRIRDMQPETL